MLTKTIRKVINGIMEIFGKEKTAKEIFYDTELTNHWIEIIAWKVKEALPKEELPEEKFPGDSMLKMRISEQLSAISFPEYSPIVEISLVSKIDGTQLLMEENTFSAVIEEGNWFFGEGNWSFELNKNTTIEPTYESISKYRLKDLQYQWEE